MLNPTREKTALSIFILILLQSCLLFEDAEIKVAQFYDPQVTIISPISTGNYYSDQAIEFVAKINDEDTPHENLTINWFNQDTEVELDLTVDEEGNHSGSMLLSSGVKELTITVSDELGQSSSESVTIQVTKNTKPECFIYTQNQNISISNTLLLEAFAEDIESDEIDLLVQFSSNLDGVIGTTSPNNDGIISIQTSFETIGNHTITMTVTDEAGSTCTDQQIWGVLNGPLVEIIQPINGDIFPTGSPILFEGIISDLEDLHTEINVEWESATNGTLFIMTPDEDGLSIGEVTGLYYGHHTITLTADDSDGLYGVDSVDLTVNTQPQVQMSFGPNHPDVNETIYCSAYPEDPDPAEVEPTVEYSLTGIFTGETYTATAISQNSVSLSLTSIGASIGDKIECIVTVTDELGASTQVSDIIVVGER